MIAVIAGLCGVFIIAVSFGVVVIIKCASKLLADHNS